MPPGTAVLDALVVTGLVSTGCSASPPAGPTFDARGTDDDAGAHDGAVREDATVGETGSDATAAGYDICPDGMASTFPSIYTQLLSTESCGIGRLACHSTAAALPQAEGGTGSLLDFSLDAAAVYAELLGVDGGGYPAVDVAGDAGGVLLRVAPGDAGASMLYIKLALTTISDPRYGQAMPPVQTLCPPAIDAVEAWIDDGASAK
jgi:hypothetical protein